jgi:hypothetical protein
MVIQWGQIGVIHGGKSNRPVHQSVVCPFVARDFHAGVDFGESLFGFVQRTRVATPNV